MKTILDEGVPEDLAEYFAGNEVSTVKWEGWRGIKNGKLLDLIESAAFEVFITADKRMEHEQNFSGRPFAILLLSTNHWPTIEPNVGKVAVVLTEAPPGVVTKVDCGIFVAKRFRIREP